MDNPNPQRRRTTGRIAKLRKWLEQKASTTVAVFPITILSAMWSAFDVSIKAFNSLNATRDNCMRSHDAAVCRHLFESDWLALDIGLFLFQAMFLVILFYLPRLVISRSAVVKDTIKKICRWVMVLPVSGLIGIIVGAFKDVPKFFP